MRTVNKHFVLLYYTVNTVIIYRTLYHSVEKCISIIIELTL